MVAHFHTMVRSWILLLLGVQVLCGAGISNATADAFPCAAALYDDRPLLNTIPVRLKNMFDGSRGRLMIHNREEAWAPVHSLLTGAMKNLDQKFEGNLGTLRFHIQFSKNERGLLQLQVLYVQYGTNELGRTAEMGLPFFDFVGAMLTWISKMRAQGEFQEIEIVGHDLRNERLVETLSSLGFIEEKVGRDSCFTKGLLIGGGLGFVFGAGLSEVGILPGEGIHSATKDAFSSGAIFSATGAMVGSFGFCHTHQKKNYSFQIRP